MGLPTIPSFPRPPAAVLAAAFGLAACGGVGPDGPLVPRSPWSEDLAPAFDDAVDFVSPIRGIQGTPWFEQYSDQVSRRVGEADVIAVVDVRSISLGTDRSPITSVDVVVVESLLGPAAVGRALRLELAMRSPAHDSFERSRQRVLDQRRFVAYLRLYEDPDGQVRSHWHMSPPDPELLDIVRRLIDEL